MGTKEAWQILTEYRKMDGRVAELTERLRLLRESATRMSSVIGGTRTSTGLKSSRVEKVGVRCADLARQLDAEIDRLNERRFMIQDAIDRMSDVQQQRVLELRYLDGSKWYDIMAALGYRSSKSVYDLHQAALLSFAGAWEDEKSN